MTAAFLAALALSLGLRLWLSRRQVAFVRAHRDAVPAAFLGRVPSEAHEKAADYTVVKQRLLRVSLLARAAVLLAWTLGGGVDLLARHLSGAWFVLAAFGITELFLLPLTIYSVFSIETRFGFNRTTPTTFLLDLLKSAIVGVAIGWPLCAGALLLMERGGALWWVWAWAGWMAFSLFLAWVYPTFLAPLFNKFTPLEDGELKSRIEHLMKRAGFAAKGLYVMDGSRRSAHANAYFTGWGGSKRVVLYDTLCEMLGLDEIEAVLAHELGHFKRRHIWKRMAAGAACSLLGLGALALLAGRAWFFSGLGVTHASSAAALLLFLWVAPLFTFPLTPFWSAWSRRHEYEADAYAASQAKASALVSALVKMYDKNAATLTPDPLHSAYYDSHPPASLRIARLEG